MGVLSLAQNHLAMVGATDLPHKAAALLHIIRLECGTDPRAMATYCEQVVSCLSDQGYLELTWTGKKWYMVK